MSTSLVLEAWVNFYFSYYDDCGSYLETVSGLPTVC